MGVRAVQKLRGEREEIALQMYNVVKVNAVSRLPDCSICSRVRRDIGRSRSGERREAVEPAGIVALTEAMFVERLLTYLPRKA